MPNWWEPVAQLGFAVFVAVILLKQMIYDKNKATKHTNRSIQCVAVTLIALQKELLIIKSGYSFNDGEHTDESCRKLAEQVASLHAVMGEQRVDIERIFREEK